MSPAEDCEATGPVAGRPPGLRVPAFDLYGEQSRTVLCRFFHIEALCVRNAPNDWGIGAHHHPTLHQFSIQLSGHAAWSCDGASFRATAPCCVYLPAGIVHRFQYEPHADGFIVSISQDLLQEIASDNRHVADALARFSTVSHVDLTPDAGRTVGLICDLLAARASSPRRHQLAVAAGHFATLILELDAAIPATRSAAEPSDRSLFDKFRAFVDQQLGACSGTRRGAPTTVTAVAAALATSPYALNNACRQSVGMGARALLDEAMATMATRLLLYSDQSIKQIAFRLGYAQPSHFVRAFKQWRGVSPGSFRSACIGDR